MKTAEQFILENVKKQYGMPFLEIGTNVMIKGKAVRITGVSNSGLKGKLINDGNKEIAFHPTWETAYCDGAWNVIHDYRK